MSFSQYLRQLGQPIAYYPQLAKPLGGVTAAVLFGQLFYWQDKTDNPLGVYKTLDELMEETGLTERELRSAREKLRELGVVIETNKRLEHRLYFKIDYNVLDDLMALWLFREESKRHSADSQNVIPPNDKTSFREESKRHSVNTVITTENTNNNPPVSPQGEPSPDETKKSQSGVEVENPEMVDLPDYVNRESWIAYCQMRKAKRSAIKTEHTLKLCLRDLAKHSGGNAKLATAILEQSIANCWTGIFALKGEFSKPSGAVNAHDKSGAMR